MFVVYNPKRGKNMQKSGEIRTSDVNRNITVSLSGTAFVNILLSVIEAYVAQKPDRKRKTKAPVECVGFLTGSVKGDKIKVVGACPYQLAERRSGSNCVPWENVKLLIRYLKKFNFTLVGFYHSHVLNRSKDLSLSNRNSIKPSDYSDYPDDGGGDVGYYEELFAELKDLKIGRLTEIIIGITKDDGRRYRDCLSPQVPLKDGRIRGACDYIGDEHGIDFGMAAYLFEVGRERDYKDCKLDCPHIESLNFDKLQGGKTCKPEYHQKLKE
jgi:proteasome lid subunit RPN8/RPN11